MTANEENERRKQQETMKRMNERAHGRKKLRN